MRKALIGTALLAVALVLGPSAWAEDVFPPPWQLGEFPTETYQDWEFSTPDMPAFPEIDENPYGDPFIEFIGTWDGWGEEPGLDLSYTSWHVGPPSGKLSIQIHNDPNQGIRKEVWVQATSSAPPISVGSPHPGSTTAPYPPKDWGGGWGTYPYLVTIPGNPAMDYIEIEFPVCTWVEEIVVHTRCVVPEPGAMAIFGLAGLVFLSRRKK